VCTIYHYIKPFEDQRLLYEPPGLTFIVYIFSVRFSEKAVVFPYTSLIGFIKKTECVYYGLRAENLNILQVTFRIFVVKFNIEINAFRISNEICLTRHESSEQRQRLYTCFGLTAGVAVVIVLGFHRR